MSSDNYLKDDNDMGCCGCIGFILMVYISILILRWMGLL